MMDGQTTQQARFEGWAVCEIFGHQVEAGFVTTEYFGSAALFRVDVPAFDEREFELKRPQWIGDNYAPIGSRVKRAATPARTRLVGPSAIFSMTPCTEEAARLAIENNHPRPLMVVSLAERTQLTEAHEPSEDIPFDEEDDEMEPIDAEEQR
jgi:hypothetical protein